MTSCAGKFSGKFYSTGSLDYSKHPQSLVSAKQAILAGLAPDGGLYLPVELPLLPAEMRSNPERYSFQQLAFSAAEIFLGQEIPAPELEQLVSSAFDFPLPLVRLGESNTFVLELFWGPTLAFKDFGARFMSRVVSYFRREESRELTILVATSGDTGSAVASGFFNVPGIRVVILYPSGKVSPLQEQQLTTHGGNISALEVEGTFDDCQALVKQAFADGELRSVLDLSSANSINIARLIPQSFYYLHLIAELKRIIGAEFNQGDICVSVPSGNFGNLCAGLLAKKMGLGPKRFIAATNVNDVVVQYLSGEEFLPRKSQATISNAMDVGNPSNFARLQALYGGQRSALQEDISGVAVTEEQTRAAILRGWTEYNYLFDPHGAVGFSALETYRAQAEESAANIGVVLATAHPAKFIETIQEITPGAVELPEPLKDALAKTKQATSMPADYAALRSYLLG